MVSRASLVLALIVAATPGLVAEVAAQAPERVGVVTALGGTPMLARDSVRDDRALAFRDEVFAGDRIRTGPGAFARVLADGRRALVSVAEQSSVRLAREGDALRVRIETGKVTVIADKSDDAAPRRIRIETDSAVASLRGTAVIAEARDRTMTFIVLRGEVEVAGRNASTVILHALDAVRVVGGVLGPVEHVTADAAVAALQDFGGALSVPRSGPDTAPDFVARQLHEAEVEMRRRGMTRVPDGPTSPEVPLSMPVSGQPSGQNRTPPLASSPILVTPQPQATPTPGRSFIDTGPGGRTGARFQSP